jgi:hypothetical protein
MSIGKIFSAVKDSTTAHFFNHMSSQPVFLTGTELNFLIATGSKLHMMDGRYHATAWNKFYPVFITLIKNMSEEAKHFSQSSHL